MARTPGILKIGVLIIADDKHGLDVNHINNVAEFLAISVMKGYNSKEVLLYLPLITRYLSKDDQFNKDLLNALTDMHEMYYFMDNHQDQLSFFVAFITELQALRDDWECGPDVQRYLPKIHSPTHVNIPQANGGVIKLDSP